MGLGFFILTSSTLTSLERNIKKGEQNYMTVVSLSVKIILNTLAAELTNPDTSE